MYKTKYILWYKNIRNNTDDLLELLQPRAPSLACDTEDLLHVAVCLIVLALKAIAMAHIQANLARVPPQSRYKLTRQSSAEYNPGIWLCIDFFPWL